MIEDIKDEIIESDNVETNKLYDNLSKRLKPTKHKMIRILIGIHYPDWIKENYLKRRKEGRLM